MILWESAFTMNGRSVCVLPSDVFGQDWNFGLQHSKSANLEYMDLPSRLPLAGNPI